MNGQRGYEERSFKVTAIAGVLAMLVTVCVLATIDVLFSTKVSPIQEAAGASHERVVSAVPGAAPARCLTSAA